MVSNFEMEEDELENLQSQTEEVINLDKAELKQNMFGSYITYTMTNNKNEKIERKYNDFVLLRKAFVQNFPGCYIPKIPEKRMGVDKVKDEKTENFELRKLQLVDFTTKLSSVAHLVSSDIYKSFLNSKANINQALKNYLTPTKKDVLNRLKEVFFDLSGKEINAELLHKIEVFDESLKARLPVLKQFKAMICQNTVEFYANNQKMSTLLTALDKFEGIFLEYTKDTTLSKQASKNDEFGENFGSRFGIFKELQNEQNWPYYELEAFINNEIADYEAFIEAIKAQKVYLSNRRSVRFQLDKQLEQFNAFDFQSVKQDKVRKIQQKIESLEIEFNEIDLLCNIMIVVMGYYEMERFEIEKYRLYWEAIAKFSKQQIANQTEILGFYQYLKNLSAISSESQ